MADQPAWMRAVLRAERILAGPLTRATNSSEAASALLLVARSGRLARNLAQGARAVVVHALDLPTHRDVQLLDAKVERLQRTMEDWSAELRDWRKRS